MSSVLSSLKLISAKRQTSIDPVLFRRQKLSKMLQEQISLATAYMNNTTYTDTQKKRVRDENGFVHVVDVQKRVKPWWFTSSDNKVALTVRYGNRAIEFAKGKNAIEISDAKSLIVTLEKLEQATLEGHLDEQLTQASNNVKARFKK
jgi:hypothetical protein